MIYVYLAIAIVVALSVLFAVISFCVAKKEREARRKKEKEDAEKIMRLERENAFMQMQADAKKNAREKADNEKKKIDSGSAGERVNAAASVFGLQNGGSGKNN